MTTNFFVTPSTRVVEKNLMIMNALDPLNFSSFFCVTDPIISLAINKTKHSWSEFLTSFSRKRGQRFLHPPSTAHTID